LDAKLRIIIRLPLAELWRDDGFATSERGSSLTGEDIRHLLTLGPAQFVIADIGAAPQWVSESECFHFWKNEVRPRLASDEILRLDEFPGVVLEKHH
jgi:hypothetical protein